MIRIQIKEIDKIIIVKTHITKHIKSKIKTGLETTCINLGRHQLCQTSDITRSM